MEKIIINSTLNHKAQSYEPMLIEVEKVITLYGKRFNQMIEHPLSECPEIIENKDLMFVEGNTAHCILFLDANGNDGILVESEGAVYARKSQFIPNARAIVEQRDFTFGERQFHAELKDVANRIAELAHTGQSKFLFEDMLDDCDIKAIMIKAVAEMLSRRSDLAEVRDHYLGIEGQPEFTIIAKPTNEWKFYSPLEIRIDENDECDLEVISSRFASDCKDEINKAIKEYSEPGEEYRGLMVYYDEDSPINEKIVSAFPSVEVRNGELMGVLTCELTEHLTDREMKEFQSWWEGQCSDGWGEGFEQRGIKTDTNGEIYVSFWNASYSWKIETKINNTTDIEEEESINIGGISM